MIAFTARSDPRPKGSKKAILHRTTGRAIVIEDSDRSLRQWEASIRIHAQDAMEAAGQPVFEGAVELAILFRLRRPAWAIPGPKSKRIAPTYPETKPDVDKLARAVQDALRTIVYKDDAQVAVLIVEKAYTVGGEAPGAHVKVSPLKQDVAVFEPLPNNPVRF